MEILTMEQFKEATENGKIFTVEFIKRTNGERRVMNCRRGVTKGVKGVGLKFDPNEKDLLVVYDMQKLVPGKDEKGAFRMINLSDLISLKLDGKKFAWNRTERRFDRVV